MTDWSDDRLEEVLRDTFASREDLADPDRAVTLVPTHGPRRRWPVMLSAAAAVALVAGGTSYVVGRGSDAPSPRPSSATSPTPPPQETATTQDNIEATRAMSAWLLHAVPMPPGSHELSSSPTALYRRPPIGAGPADSAFTDTTWWTVPLGAAGFEQWLTEHHPTELRLDPDEGATTIADGQRSDNRVFEVDGSAAWTPAFLAIDAMPYGDGLAVRVDTFIAARFARTAFVPGDVTAVSVLRTVRPAGGSDCCSTDHLSHRVTDAAGIADLVDLVNALPGSMTGTFVSSCPAMLSETAYRLRFSSPEGDYRLRLRTGCWAQATLVVDGSATQPTLDPGTHFMRALDRYLPELRDLR